VLVILIAGALGNLSDRGTLPGQAGPVDVVTSAKPGGEVPPAVGSFAYSADLLGFSRGGPLA
jgi:hypothetical protein